VQEEILQRHPSARLRVYAIWTVKQLGDARGRWDAAGLTDRRVVHLWDERGLTGRWFVDNLAGYRGPDWDTYLLFGPEARWAAGPPPLRSAGWTVVDAIGDLEESLAPLL